MECLLQCCKYDSIHESANTTFEQGRVDFFGQYNYNEIAGYAAFYIIL